MTKIEIDNRLAKLLVAHTLDVRTPCKGRPPMPHSRRSVLHALLIGVIAAAPVAAGQNPFKRDSKVEYSPFRDPSGQFALEFPKDWQVIGGADTVTFAQKKSEAALVVERIKYGYSARAGRRHR